MENDADDNCDGDVSGDESGNGDSENHTGDEQDHGAS